MNPPPPVTNTFPVPDIRATLPKSRRPERSLLCARRERSNDFPTECGGSALGGGLLLLGTWDGLYSRLDLPQALPALGPQIGGVALLSLASVLWPAGSNPALRPA